uniref:Secreted protein n=1 Tax=Electrophorus electricus TaxID=8005 RepID=A0AAY5EPY6_ELEEL
MIRRGILLSDSWRKMRLLACFSLMWQLLVVTELTPEHHSREKSQGSFTTHRLTFTFLLRKSLSHKHTDTHTHTQDLTQNSLISRETNKYALRNASVLTIVTLVCDFAPVSARCWLLSRV